MANVAPQTQQLTLRGGYYVARSVIANAQRCVNLYPEKNPEDSEVPLTDYLRPGLLRLRAGGAADGPGNSTSRGGYTATTGQLFVVGRAAVSGVSTLYAVDRTWRFAALGDLTLVLDSMGVGASTPVCMYDNGLSLVLVDGSTNGYQVDLGTLAMTPIVDAAFYGSDRVDYLDTFLVYNRPGTQQFYVGPSNAVTPFDPTYIAAKTGLPDLLGAMMVMHREIWLVGNDRSAEVWYNSGAPAFPFQITPGVFMEEGILAKYSIAKHSLSVFWLSRDKDGQVAVIEGKSYQANRVSTPAIEAALSKYTDAQLAAAVGMVYKQQGHVMYMLHVADATWVYDQSEGLWHEETWTDSDGSEHRHRANWTTMAYGTVVCGDWENGNLYAMALDQYEDEVEGLSVDLAASPITRRRGFPHVVKDGVMWQHIAARLDIQCGEAPISLSVEDTQVFLRWSDDRGRTWSNPVPQPLGLVGQYITQPRWPPMGIARDRVYEVFWSVPAETALNGLWVDLVRTGK